MSFSDVTNIATMIFCFAVLVQSVRMMRGFKAVKDAGLDKMVEALDMSTARAHAVLSDLKLLLAGDCAAHARTLERAEAIRDELGDMVQIADATAERLLSAAGAANGAAAEARATVAA